jgi:hypothetical protein
VLGNSLEVPDMREESRKESSGSRSAGRTDLEMIAAGVQQARTAAAQTQFCRTPHCQRACLATSWQDMHFAQ